MTKKLFIFFFFLAHSITYSQSNSQFPTLFGPEPLLAPGKDTIATTKSWLIVYDKENCNLFATNKNRKKEWSKDLKTYGCQLISALPVKQKRRKYHKGGDIYLQFANKKLYSLKLRNGKMKELKKEMFVKTFQ